MTTAHDMATHAISILVEKISQSFACKKATHGISLDLSKAFDTIDYLILLSKLNHYGVRANALKWFTSYLTGRTQQSKICRNSFYNYY